MEFYLKLHQQYDVGWRRA